VKESFAGYIGSAIDITERKAAEQEMRTFASLAGQSADFIGLASLDGGTLFVNPGGQVMVGLSDVDARRPTLLDYVVEDDRAAGAEALARARADGQWTGELTLRHFATGQPVPTSWNLCLLSNEAASPASFGLVARDLSARKRIEEDLRRQDRLKDEFLATLSHELRTPLNAIVGWAHILRAAPPESDTMPKGLETILRSAHALNRMVSDILDVSRLIAGKLILKLRPIRLASVLEGALDTMRPVAQAKNVALVGDLDVTGGGNFSGDADRLQQVVCNLLTNAVKFTPAGGSVRLFLRAAGDRFEFGVEDNGPGISPDFLPHIFERFRQADSSATRRHDGLGLGLAIVNHLAELHGGTVTAANRQGQQGAVFTVRVPREGVRDEHPMAVAPHPVEHGATWRHDAPSFHGLTVVVVDDEADARELVAMVLESCGARTIAVASAAEGLQAVMRENPDVLLADLAMPDEDGYELMRKVRALPPEQGGTTPAAALTAFASQDERLNVLRAGFQAHLAKPANPAELVATVAGLTRGAMAAATPAAEGVH
jgi:PAS domain S-box-containing protein